MPAISVSDLVVSYGGFCAVSGLSFSVEPGEIVTLLGPNGAGKTSTVESIEGLRRPSAGEIRVLGLDPVRDHAAVSRRLGVVLQDLGLYPQLPARRALRLTASYYRDPLDADELLERFGLSHVASTPAKRLSGGERQRLALALALVGRPEAVVLDEPTSGIDAEGRGAIRSAVASLREQGVAVMLTTHELEEAERLADRVVIIDEGHVVADGTVAELAQSAPSVRFGTSRPIDVAALSAHLKVTISAEGPSEYRICDGRAGALVAPLSAWLADAGHEIISMRSGGSTLEEVFLRITAKAGDAPGQVERRPRGRRERRAR